MSRTLTISDTLYERLEARADRAGSVERYLEERSRTHAHAVADGGNCHERVIVMKTRRQNCFLWILCAFFISASSAAHAQWKPFRRSAQSLPSSQSPLQRASLPFPDFYAPKPTFRAIRPPILADTRPPWEKLTLLEKARMHTIKVGMTRAQLMEVYQRAGGLTAARNTAPLIGTYSYQKCEYYKVNVEFAPVQPPVRGEDGILRTAEDPQDVITKISPPFLEQVYGD